MSLQTRVMEFVETHLWAVIISVAGFLVLLLAILALSLAGEARSKTARKDAASREGMKIGVEEFFLPSDPLPVPPIQRFRERKQAWSVSEAESWASRIPPDTLDALKAQARAQIDSILEAVP